MQHTLPADVITAINKLKLFNERSYRLERKKFVERIKEPFGAKTTITISRGNFTQAPSVSYSSEWVGPDEDEIDAFLFNLRLFIQPKEAISFSNIGHYYNKILPVPSYLTNEINSLLTLRKQYLKEYTKVTINDKKLKRQEVLDVFMWGEFSHISSRERETVDMWYQIGAFHQLLEAFIQTVVTHLELIKNIREINDLTIKTIQANLLWTHDLNVLKR